MGEEKQTGSVSVFINEDSCKNDAFAQSLGVTQHTFSNSLKTRDLNGVCLLLISCLKGKSGRKICILGKKNVFDTTITIADNHVGVAY